MCTCENEVDLTQQFETEICSRCHGSGKFSYCIQYGDTCFKCRGKGRVYTKRGQIALNKYNELLMVEARQLKIGDLIGVNNITNYGFRFYCVKQIIKIDENTIQIIAETTNNDQYCVDYNNLDKVRKGYNSEEKTAFKEKALKFQSCLTVSGKIYKKKLKKYMS
jgi:hypothetical protein